MPSPFLAYLKENISIFSDYIIESKQKNSSYVTGWGRDPELSKDQQAIAQEFLDYVKSLESVKEGQAFLDAEVYQSIKKKITVLLKKVQVAIQQHNTREQAKSSWLRDIKKSTHLVDVFGLYEKCLDYTYGIFKHHQVTDQPTDPSPLIQFKCALLRYWARKKVVHLMLTEYSTSYKDYFKGFVYDWELSAKKDTQVATFLEKTEDTWEGIEVNTNALLQIDNDIRDLDKKEGSVPVGIAGVTGYIPVTFSKNAASLAEELNALRRVIQRKKNPATANTAVSSARSAAAATTSPTTHLRDNYQRSTQSAPSAVQPRIQVKSPPPTDPFPVAVFHGIQEEEEDNTIVYYSDDESGPSTAKPGSQ